MYCCECVGGFCQIRDITSNPEWERAYQYEIPVLAKVRPDGTEVSFTVLVLWFFLFICLCSHLSLFKLCMSGFSLSLSNFVYY